MTIDSSFQDRQGIIIALDVESVEGCKRIIDLTTGMDGVAGYKIGLTLVLTLGLFETVRQLREHTDLPLLYDHQKAGADVFDMAPKFARICAQARVDGLILFPTAGPRAVSAFVGESIKHGMLPIVGGELPFPDYTVSGGGYVADDALERILQASVAAGATSFVVPGHHAATFGQRAELLRQWVDAPLLLVPGIGPLGGKLSDLVRAAPECRILGVVGRAVYDAQDPARAAAALIQEAHQAALSY